MATSKRFPNDSAPAGKSEQLYDPHDPIPQPDVVEKASDTTWELWADVRDKEHVRYADTMPMTQPAPAAPAMPQGAEPRPAIRPAQPQAASGLELLAQEARRNNRVSLKPEQWQQLVSVLLASASAAAARSVPPVLKGRDWQATNSLAKRHSFRNFIDWAAANGLVQPMLAHLRTLGEGDWHHMGE